MININSDQYKQYSHINTNQWHHLRASRFSPGETRPACWSRSCLARSSRFWTSCGSILTHRTRLLFHLTHHKVDVTLWRVTTVIRICCCSCSHVAQISVQSEKCLEIQELDPSHSIHRLKHVFSSCCCKILKLTCPARPEPAGAPGGPTRQPRASPCSFPAQSHRSLGELGPGSPLVAPHHPLHPALPQPPPRHLDRPIPRSLPRSVGEAKQPGRLQTVNCSLVLFLFL